ncbi:MAG: group 1 truncated hemoglobin [Candidatus Latescibacteria bacterium]|jgi:truncated hemoglobin YjbI|nr:group 1 truncated hemoglobin [Candidatus Latescibacterota bacterium]
MKRFLSLFAVCTALCLMMGPSTTFAQHDDPDMEWEDADEMAEEDGAEGMESKVLYERWGGKTAIKGVVSEFTARVMQDEKISKHFSDTDKAAYRLQLVGQLSDASGGPMFMGKTLRILHTDMGMTDDDLAIIAEHLGMAMDWFEFEQTEKDELLVKLKLKTASSMDGDS